MILQWTARVQCHLERHDQGGVVPYHPAVLVKRWCTSICAPREDAQHGQVTSIIAV